MVSDHRLFRFVFTDWFILASAALGPAFICGLGDDYPSTGRSEYPAAAQLQANSVRVPCFVPDLFATSNTAPGQIVWQVIQWSDTMEKPEDKFVQQEGIFLGQEKAGVLV